MRAARPTLLTTVLLLLVVALIATLLAGADAKPRGYKKQLFHGRIRKEERELRRYGYTPHFNAPFGNFRATFTGFNSNKKFNIKVKAKGLEKRAAYEVHIREKRCHKRRTFALARF